MKTNMDMAIQFKFGDAVVVGHKTRVVDLSALFKVGDDYRRAEGKSRANITDFQNSTKTKEFVRAVSKRLGAPESELLYAKKVGGSGVKGQPSRIMANLYVAIYAAEHLSTDFHVEVIDTFINSKILEMRDESGDQFKALNMAVDTHLAGREEKDNKGIYIQIAKILKDKIAPTDGNWNMATADQLRERLSIERKLVDYLERGFIKDWEHLKQVIIEI